MSLDLSTTSIVIDNENSRIKLTGGSTKKLEEGVSNWYYRNSSYVFNKSGTGTFKFSGSFVKVHGEKQFQYNYPTGSVKCSISPKGGTAIKVQDQDGGGSSFDTLCGFTNLSPSKSYTLTISGTKGAAIDYVEYGSTSPKNGDVVRYYPKNKGFKFTNGTYAYGYERLGERSGFKFSYTGASTVTAYVSRPDFDYPAVFNLTYDFLKTRRWSVDSMTLGNYLPLKLGAGTNVKYGSHWVELKPINNDRYLFLDFVEVPFTAKAGKRYVQETEPTALVPASSEHDICAYTVKAAFLLLFLVGMVSVYLARRRNRERQVVQQDMIQARTDVKQSV